MGRMTRLFIQKIEGHAGGMNLNLWMKISIEEESLLLHLRDFTSSNQGTKCASVCVEGVSGKRTSYMGWGVGGGVGHVCLNLNFSAKFPIGLHVQIKKIKTALNRFVLN